MSLVKFFGSLLLIAHQNLFFRLFERQRNVNIPQKLKITIPSTKKTRRHDDHCNKHTHIYTYTRICQSRPRRIEPLVLIHRLIRGSFILKRCVFFFFQQNHFYHRSTIVQKPASKNCHVMFVFVIDRLSHATLLSRSPQ